MSRSRFEVDVKVGMFITIGTVLLMIALIVLGGTDGIFSHRASYYSRFPNVEGLMPGSKVVLGGIRVGSVSDITFESSKDIGNYVRVKISIDSSYKNVLRKDASAEIATQGVLGDKYISLNAGSTSEPPLSEEGEIQPSPRSAAVGGAGTERLMTSLGNISSSLERILANLERNNRSDMLFQGLAVTAKNLAVTTERLNQELDHMKLKESIHQLHSILYKINNGAGTLGALVNDPALYDDVKSLIGGANRNRIVRNLVRQTIRKNEAEEAAAKK